MSRSLEPFRRGGKCADIDIIPESVLGKSGLTFVVRVFTVGVWALGRVDELFARSRKPSSPNNPSLLGEVIPPGALTIACSLALSRILVENDINKDVRNSCPSQGFYEANKKLESVIFKWTGQSTRSQTAFLECSTSEQVHNIQKVLIESLRQFRYPVLNQLNVLKILIDSSIHLTNAPLHVNTNAWLQEMHDLYINYNSPFHFTPNGMGLTYAMLILRRMSDEESDINYSANIDFDLKYESLKFLQESREMYTMGRSYYMNIKNLYYLHDDFNDRQIHRNHAMQMAGSQVAKIYEKILRKKEI